VKTTNLLRILAAGFVVGFSGIGCDRRATPESAAVLDADAAARLAVALANSEAKRQFGAAPFGASQDTPTLDNGYWHWQATTGYGKGDLQAVVSFTQAGSKPEVWLQTLVLEQPPKATEMPRVKDP
jgi:hypothetical protein